MNSLTNEKFALKTFVVVVCVIKTQIYLHRGTGDISAGNRVLRELACGYIYIQDCLRKLEYCDKVLYFL